VELGDKKQLAAVPMISKTGLPLIVFRGAMVAFAIVTSMGIVISQDLITIISRRFKKGAPFAFMLIGLVI
jgi:putative Ca2+/H+ antiporter (TMEM165/GDT1 family)